LRAGGPAPARLREAIRIMEQPSPHLRLRKSDGISIVEFADRKILDELSIQEIQDELGRIVAAEPAIKLLLDFRNVDHLSSAALGTLITLSKQVNEASGQLKLSNINRQIYEVFRITRLNKVFDIHETASDAMTAFSSS
jgi:anti-sigma B factor antagonist